MDTNTAKEIKGQTPEAMAYLASRTIPELFEDYNMLRSAMGQGDKHSRLTRMWDIYNIRKELALRGVFGKTSP